ncbi:uncharacterized protein LOC143070989 [Mytilus galloprovincialis]|uniref:uncharacterized protein LOC143070989 n=1 Tax=Mytilus galloprovincialis TaxID=29158 RepID=UPI003F7C4FFB
MVRGDMRTSVLDTRVMRGADVYTDHYLVRSKIRLKLARNKGDKNKCKRERYDLNKLKNMDVRKKYNIEVRNRFQVLEEGNIEDPVLKYEGAVEIYTEAAKQVLGSSKKISKPWITNNTWKMVDERKEIKKRLEGTRSERLKVRLSEEYKQKNKGVKKSAREDKRKWYNMMAEDAEKAAENGRSKELYNITKILTGERKRQHTGVKSKEGELKSERNDILNRWVEHFSEVLNRQDPLHPISEEDVDMAEIIIEEIDLGEWTVAEVKRALKKTQNGKSAGIDSVTPELIKADIDLTAEKMAEIFNSLWEEENWPSDWRKGLICKIFKKGDMTDCNNWRGVTLLPVFSKVFCRMLIERIKEGIDKRLRNEQAGFRPKRGTTEQIFILRNILEQTNEWRAALIILFIDFEKAFDSVHRESMVYHEELWNTRQDNKNHKGDI